MKIEGQRDFAAGRELLWSILNDPATMRRLLPGCAALEPAAADGYGYTLDIRLGREMTRMTGTLVLEQVVPYHSFGFRAGGGRCQITLEDIGDGTTLRYEADLTPGGPLPVSPRLAETTARAFARRALDALEKEVVVRTQVYTTTAMPMNTPARSLSPDAALQRAANARRAQTLALLLLLGLLLWRLLSRRRTRRIAEVVEQVLEQSGATPLPATNEAA